jgi:hypothetical protein
MTMNTFLNRTVAAVRDVFTIDPKVEIFLHKTQVEVRRTSRLWGV